MSHDIQTSNLDDPLMQLYTQDVEIKRVLGFEPILLKRIIQISLPVIIGMLTQTAINQIDLAMIGRIPGPEAIAGAAALMPAQILLWAVGGFLSAISVGTQAITARRFGEGNVSKTGQVLTNSALVAFTTSLTASIVCFFLAPTLFSLNSNDPQIQEVGTSYLQIRYLGTFSMVMMASYKSFFDGLGRVKIHMFVAIFMNIMNILLNYLLIFGEGGFPAMGIRGAAWASVISSLAGFAVMLYITLRKEERQKFKVYHWKNFDMSVAKKVTSLSFWSGLAIFFAMIGFALFFKIVEMEPGEQSIKVVKAAVGLVTSIGLIPFMASIAYGAAIATLISQSMGAKKPDLAYRYGVQAVYFMVTIMGIFGLLAAVIPDFVVGLFLKNSGTESAQVLELAASLLRKTAIAAPISAFALIFAQALYGAGESRFVMLVEGGLHFICLVPLAYFLAVTMKMGLIGAFLALGVYGIALAAAVGYKFFQKGWQQTEI